ncbi:MAG TPA: hypothetical protein VG101_19125 [Puia sp.]|jgi:hypothetical protein|nr:hypothetical protein [Puia sp.]
MYDDLKVGEEVSFPGLLEIKLIVEEVHEFRVRCKYYDDHLKKYVRLTVSSDALIRSNPLGRQSWRPTSVPAPGAIAPPDPANDIC